MGTPHFIKQILLDIKPQINPNIAIADFNTPPSPADMIFGQRTNRETLELNDT